MLQEDAPLLREDEDEDTPLHDSGHAGQRRSRLGRQRKTTTTTKTKTPALEGVSDGVRRRDDEPTSEEEEEEVEHGGSGGGSGSGGVRERRRGVGGRGGRGQGGEQEQEQEQEEEEQEQEQDDIHKHKNKNKIRNDNCCFPVASCLSSCFGGMGFGFRQMDAGNDESSTRSVIDTRMWEIVKNSAAFKNTENSAFCINISRLSDLQGVLGSAVKPFIKVHIVNIDTGHYVRPDSTGKVSVSRTAPLLTRQAGLKGTSSDVPQWDEDIIFPNLSFKDVVSPKNLLLFELLDDPPSLSFRKVQSINSSKEMGSMIRTYSTLAWAFLLPVGQKVNVGYPKVKRQSDSDSSNQNMKHSDYDMSLRLQLYQYKVDTVVTKLQRIANRWPAAENAQQKRKKTETLHRYPDNIPEVYFQYKRKNLDVVCKLFIILIS